VHPMASGQFAHAAVKILSFMARNTVGEIAAAKDFAASCLTLTPTARANGFALRESGCTNRSAPKCAFLHKSRRLVHLCESSQPGRNV
jgi:hypothetical protein